jgi:lipopolysaccharide transport system ATP-binding protein
MEFQVLKSGHKLYPYYTVFNEQGIRVMSAIDRDPSWQGIPREPGHYRITAWIPGNLLSEGTYFVDVAMRTPQAKIRHFHERQTIAFHVIDNMSGDTARGNFGGRMSGVVRPLLDWESQFSPFG